MTDPASVISDGNVLVLWVPTISNQNAPTVAELTAGSVLDLTGYLTDEGWDPNLTEDVAPDNRLSSTQNFQKAGRKTTQMPLIYVTNPASPSDDEAALTLLEKETGYFVDRRGVSCEDAIQAGDIVTVYNVELGTQADVKPTANTPQYVKQMAYLRPPGRSWRVEVAA